MCAIIGALFHNISSLEQAQEVSRSLNYIAQRSRARGRDGFGWSLSTFGMERSRHTSFRVANDDFAQWTMPDSKKLMSYDGAFICNIRAEPTTEYVKEKQQHDQQPYQVGLWSIAHNGTIANDKELRTYKHPSEIDSAAIVECLDILGHQLFVAGKLDLYAIFRQSVQQLVGSYSILAKNEFSPDMMMVAANYRPVWYAETKNGVFFASAAEYFPPGMVPVMLEPYSTACFDYTTGRLRIWVDSLHEAPYDRRPRALVVASGGMDSTVAAVDCIAKGMEVELIHFTYGCRAEGHEITAFLNIANKLNVSATLFPMDIYNPADSRLFDKESTIAGGEEGAEYAHEWVPARNLVMLSLATAMAEAKGFDYIVLGNNLEEAGAYPDNEPEFIRKFNQLLPFAVGDGKRVEVLMPVGDLMKHEIVKLGVELNAPLALTWSCYKHGERHCGKCGPCFMRKTAFEINGFREVIHYEE